MIQLVLMTLFFCCSGFPFRYHFLVLPCVISPVCRLHYPYSCFPFPICFLVFVFLFVLRLTMLLLAAILIDLNNAVVWMVTIFPVISNYSCPLSISLGTVPSQTITSGINVLLMFHSIFRSPARSKYLPLFLFSLIFYLWSAGTAKSTKRQVLTIPSGSPSPLIYILSYTPFAPVYCIHLLSN